MNGFGTQLQTTNYFGSAEFIPFVDLPGTGLSSQPHPKQPQPQSTLMMMPTPSSSASLHSVASASHSYNTLECWSMDNKSVDVCRHCYYPVGDLHLKPILRSTYFCGKLMPKSEYDLKQSEHLKTHTRMYTFETMQNSVSSGDGWMYPSIARYWFATHISPTQHNMIALWFSACDKCIRADVQAEFGIKSPNGYNSNILPMS